MTYRTLCASGLALIGNAMLFVTASSAQITGFTPASTPAELAAEKRLIAEIRPDSLRSIVTAISSEIHVAGTPAQARTRDYVIDRWKRAGLETAVYPYEVFIPHAKSSSLDLLGNSAHGFLLHERPTSLELDQTLGDEYPWVNGYSAPGTVTADVIYVNYGLHEDYHNLDSLGISVKGKIVIARYGRSYRGIKAMLAEQHGAKGLIIFSDPSGDGYDAGDVFPVGPMRARDGVQRGSIYNGHGDPTTPGYASVAGAHRVPLDSITTLPHIPVIPVSYIIAGEILSKLRGHDIPNSDWQGGLAFRYHIGGEGTQVKMNVTSDSTLKPIWNTVATITGSTYPDEWIIVGGHRDAWCYGAEDNASGCASVVAAAEAFAKLAKEGIRPKRSILFVTWDAEEWGLLGSTEWVEQLEQELGKKAVAYINQDMCATGSSFGASADPSLRQLVYEVSKSLKEEHDISLFNNWVKSSRTLPKEGEEARPEIGLLGGGSDFSAFYNHLGIPSLEHGFGGPFGQYHSNHDNINWTLHFGDSTFQYHAESSQFAAIEAMRLANADILPFDFSETAKWLTEVVHQSKLNALKEFRDNSSFSELETSLAKFTSAASEYTTTRDKKAILASPPIPRNLLSQLNQKIRSVGLAFTQKAGLPHDTWTRNLLVISDPQNGYADVKLPSIELSLRNKSKVDVDKGIAELNRAVTEATAILRTIIESLNTQ